MSRDHIDDPAEDVAFTLRSIRDTLDAILETMNKMLEVQVEHQNRETPWLTFRRMEPSKRCGCNHPPHPGVVCGWPVEAAEHGTNCECEG